MLHSPDDSRLTPDQRRREIANILARGILRLARETRTTRESANPEAEEHAPDPAQKALEVFPTPRPHVTRG